MELPYDDNSPPIFAANPENKDPGAAIPHQHGSFNPGYEGSIFRREEFSGDPPSASPRNDDAPHGSQQHHHHPPNCKSCGKPKIAAAMTADVAQNHQEGEEDAAEFSLNNSSPNSAWKIVLWVVLGVVGLVIIVAIFRCVGSNSGSLDDVKSPFSSPNIPSLVGANVNVQA